MTYRNLVLVLVALCFLGSICENVPERQWERGFFEPIGGKDYHMHDALDPRYILGADDEIPSSELPLQMVVNNGSGNYVTELMPAGLVFDCLNPEYQYMILLQDFSFGAPPYQDTTVVIPTYCCNEALDEPDDESYYEVDIQVWERELNELIDLVRGKELVGYDAIDLAQEALFEITDGEGLTDSTRTKLQNLP